MRFVTQSDAQLSAEIDHHFHLMRKNTSFIQIIHSSFLSRAPCSCLSLSVTDMFKIPTLLEFVTQIMTVNVNETVKKKLIYALIFFF